MSMDSNRIVSIKSSFVSFRIKSSFRRVSINQFTTDPVKIFKSLTFPDDVMLFTAFET